jgi:hypothetical protein
MSKSAVRLYCDLRSEPHGGAVCAYDVGLALAQITQTAYW